MAHQSWKRSGLGLPGSTESASERTLHSNEYGQGPGWWIKHQCNGLGARTQERLGLFRGGSRQPRLELLVSTEYLTPHRRLAWRARPKVPRTVTAGFRPATICPLP